MANLRCFLCGGRVSGGTCTECGMPQRQHAQNYYLNESSCDNRPLTHVHEESDGPFRRSYAEREQRREKRTSYAKEERRRESGKFPLKAIAAVIFILIVFAVLFSVIVGIRSVSGAVSDIFEDFGFEVELEEPTRSWFDDSHWEVDDSYYEFAAYELEETGDYGNTGLYAGYYVVGYDLPEGTYELEMLSGRGDISVADLNNFINIYEILDAEGQNGYVTIGNLQLYNGAQVKITGSAQMRLVTENAGPIIPCMENPLQGNPDVVIPGDQMYQAGVDFPAGTYDLTLEGNFDYVDIFTLSEDVAILENGDPYDYEYESYIDWFCIRDPLYEEGDEGYLDDYAHCVENVTIEEGTYVRISDPENVLYLTPSEFVVPEEGVNYGEYY